MKLIHMSENEQLYMSMLIRTKENAFKTMLTICGSY